MGMKSTSLYLVLRRRLRFFENIFFSSEFGERSQKSEVSEKISPLHFHTRSGVLAGMLERKNRLGRRRLHEITEQKNYVSSPGSGWCILNYYRF